MKKTAFNKNINSTSRYNSNDRCPRCAGEFSNILVGGLGGDLHLCAGGGTPEASAQRAAAPANL